MYLLGIRFLLHYTSCSSTASGGDPLRADQKRCPLILSVGSVWEQADSYPTTTCLTVSL